MVVELKKPNSPAMKSTFQLWFVASALSALAPLSSTARSAENPGSAAPLPTFYRITQVDGLNIFYREAGPGRSGDPAAPWIPDLLADVPELDTGTSRSLSPRRTGLSRVWTQFGTKR